MLSTHQITVPFHGDAFDLFTIFKENSGVFFLDSSLRRSQGRFSYIGFDPFKTIRGGDLAGFKRVFGKYRIGPQRLPFPAGAVGYLGYDGSLYFGLYDTILKLDHQKRQLIVSGFSRPKIKEILNVIPNQEKGDRALKTGKIGDSALFFKNRALSPIFPVFKSNFTKAAYIQAVRRALEHISRGDIYQVNLSHRIQVQRPSGLRPAELYGALRRAFPSEYGAYLDDGRQVILSVSPERLLRLQGRRVQVKPMKGTRPRGMTLRQDRALKEQLLRNLKEIAELLMITDLERNDLGKVCDYGSVKVTSMRTIEAYESVFQATSTIEGRLRRDRDQFDLLRAVFPGGSVTGCPKIEAMKIIKKLEGVPRGLYTGALGYMSFSGDMDLNVLIRTMFLGPRRITFHVGGGIVADSSPEDEWQETWDKARPLMETIRKFL